MQGGCKEAARAIQKESKGICKGDTAGIQEGGNKATKVVQWGCHGDARGIKKGKCYSCNGVTTRRYRGGYNRGYNRDAKGVQYSFHRASKGDAALHPTQHTAPCTRPGDKLGGGGRQSLSQGWGRNQGAQSSATFPMEKSQRLKLEHPTGTFTPEIGFLSLPFKSQQMTLFNLKSCI